MTVSDDTEPPCGTSPARHRCAYQERHHMPGIIGLANRGPVSGGNQNVSGAHARALGNQAGANVHMACQYPPRSAVPGATERRPEQRIVP